MGSVLISSTPPFSEQAGGSGEVSPHYSQFVRTVFGPLQDTVVHDEAQDLLVGHALVGLLSQCGDFPQHHTEGPTGRLSLSWGVSPKSPQARPTPTPTKHQTVC